MEYITDPCARNGMAGRCGIELCEVMLEAYEDDAMYHDDIIELRQLHLDVIKINKFMNIKNRMKQLAKS